MAVLFSLPALSLAYSPNPDLTVTGAIAALKADTNSSPVYSESYNLGPTGLRGWIYIDRNNMGNDGLQTAQSRQILVSVVGAGTPAATAGLAVDDVILGAKGGTGTVTAFTGDCRKAFGWAIGDAESAANGGVLSVLRWRSGTTSTVAITLPVMGSYTDTAPYSCPKSALILANARTSLVSQLKANSNFLSTNYGGAIKGMALMAGVVPTDTDYATVQTRLQTFAHALVPAAPLTGCDTWNWGYIGIFLSEYYLRSVADGAPDATVLNGVNAYAVALAKGQSKYGTFGHGGAEAHADGSLHGSISWYGPVNSAGIPANIAIAMGKKALLAGSYAIDPEIDPAIDRGAKFFGWYVNKGAIPYGEHEPYGDGHASNGKDEMCSVLFGVQDNRPVEAEFFARMSVAGCTGREYGHTGQGFSYLWGAMGANMGGPTAAAQYMKAIRWHLDLERRTDGSFVYDGGEQYGGGTTSDGTYLGTSGYNDVNSTASYILSYALPLQRLYITGKDANPAHTLDATKVADAIAASTFKQDCVTYTNAALMTALGAYDPAMRSNAATQLATRSLSTTEINTLITMAEGSDANTRMGACETLGDLKNASALPALGRRLSDSDYWVRGKAANALKNFGSAASSQLTTMLTAFTANATDPDVIVWTDPVQIANGYLANTLFQALENNTNALSGTDRTNLLYPAVRVGLNQPDGMAQMYLSDFIQNKLTWTDVQAVAPSLVSAVAHRSPADRMFSDVIRDAGLQTLAKFKIEEGIPLCLMMKEQAWHSDDWTPFVILTNTYRGAAKDALPTLLKWQAHLPQFAADSSTNTGTRLANITSYIASTIAAIQNDTAPPTLANFKSLTVSASPATVSLPSGSTVLTPTLVDMDGGTPNFVWSKVSGPGGVMFNPSGMSANATCTASFSTPGTYVLRATAEDRSILDYNNWITYCLGYFDFQTYNEILGAVGTNLTVIVTPDANRAPVPQNQSLTTPLNTALAITLAGSDPNGDALTYAVVASPAHGSLTGTAPNLTYTPTTGYTGADNFTFKANDGQLDSVAATITIDVGTTGNRRPVAANQWLTTAEDTTKAITLGGTDPDSDTLTYQIVSGPLHGLLIGTAPNLTYMPAANYPAGNSPGADSFTFTVSDAALTSALATVSITVTPINDPPLATAQSVNLSANTPTPITLAGVDPEGYALVYAVVASPSHGTLSGTAPNLTYQPITNYRGADSFTFKVTDADGLSSAVATVSLTIINDPPVANAQSVELPPNTAKAITLTGSDSANDPLTYSVLTQPAHGGFTGTAPNLTYTPATDYIGADSFTFKVNDGVSDSPAATVTLNVAPWLSMTNIASGNWSLAANWSGGVAPAAAGSSTGLLVFNTSGYSGTSNNDLTGTFQLNRFTIGSSQPALTLSGNALSFVLNSAILPQVNQNSANALSVSNNIALAANTTLGGSGAGAVTLSGVISGAGGITKTTSGILTLSSVTTTNSFSGGITLSAGTLVLDTLRTNLGTGTVTLAGGTTFYTTNFEGNSSAGAISNTFNLSGGLVTLYTSKDIWLTGSVTGPGGLVITGNGRTPGVMLAGAKTFSGGVKLTALNGANPTVSIDNINSLGTGVLRSELSSTSISGNLESRAAVTTAPGVLNPIELASGCRLVVNANGTSNLWLAGVISGAGGLVKIGSATLTLSGTNTYTGTTTVSVGTLACSTAASLGGGTLAISSGAKVALNFSGTRTISALSLAGVAQPNGIYSAATSPTYISGTGTLTVAPATSTALALTGGVTPASPGDALTFTATVSGSTPTGNVAFYAGATLLGTSALSASYQAVFTTSILVAGTNNITATYAGNPSNGASTSAVLAIQVLGPPSPPTNLAAISGNNSVGLTWSASASATGYYVKRATVSGGPYIPIGTAGGTSYSDTSALNGTTYYYVVSSTNIAGEGANTSQVSATPAPPQPSTTTLASSLGSSGAYGANVTFTATVAVTGGPATGTVTFNDGATVLGTAALSAGQASYSIATLAGGSHSISATYGGSLAFVASTSSVLSYAVVPKSVTITGVTASNKTYDGSNAATLSGGVVAGTINGDVVSVIAGTGSFASASVGTWAVTASGYALGGAYVGNYVLAAQPTVANATISAVTGVVFTYTALNISASATGSEILNTGTLVEANHFYGTNAAVTLANGLTFGTSGAHTIPALWSGGQATSTDAHNNVPLLIDTTPFGKLMHNYTWSSGTTDTLTVPGLTPGHTYRLQLISVAGKNAGVVVESSASTTWTDSYSGTPSLLTAIWVQGVADTSLNVTLTRNTSFSGLWDNELEANGYALHDITPNSPLNDILTFTFPTFGAATIAGTDISLTVPSGTPLTAMAPTYTVSPNATGAPVSGTSRNFTSPQTYTITAQDLSTKTYTVSVTPVAPPAVPTNLVATAGSNTVGLTWSAASGATSYNVRRSSISGSSYTLLGTSSTASYTDATAINGSTYYYVVSATNGGGESANSSEAGATPALAASTTTLAASTGITGDYGTAVTLTATVNASASGTVSFKDGTTVLGTGSVSAGVASFTTTASMLAMGSHSLSASYLGDATYAPSYSAALIYTVTPKVLTLTGVTASNKVYDKTTTATLSAGSLSAGVAGEIVTVIAGSGTFASANVGTWAVTASGYSLTGADAGNYVLSAQPSVANASITPRPLQLAGTRSYDATATAAAGILSIANNLDGANLTLTGSAALAAKDVGAQALSNTVAAAQVQFKAANTGTVSTATSFTATLAAAPSNGNTLIAVIATRSTSQGRITSITQTGATWSRATQSAAGSSTGSTTEIWYAPNVSGAATQVTINQTSGARSAAVVIEYSGVLTASALDVVASSYSAGTAGTSASTGTTATATAQAYELWIGGIGLVSSGYSLSNIPSSFTTVTSAQSTNNTATNNAKVYALQSFASATGTANSSATISSSSQWSGAIATFKASISGLILGGSAASNYTLTGLTGSVQVTAKTLTASGLAASGRAYNGTPVSALTGTAALLTAQAAGSGTSSDGKPYTGDTLTLSGTAAGSFADKHAGTSKPVTVTGITLGGAAAANYNLTQPAGLTATITQLPVTVAAVSASKTYDRTTSAAGTPTLTPALAAGDTTSVLAQAFQSAGAGTGNKVIVPSITINDANGGANYNLTLTNFTTGTISQAAAEITGVTASGKTYDGTPVASLSGGTLTGILDGDTVTLVAGSGSFASAGAGLRAITASGYALGGIHAANYALSAQPTVTSAIIAAKNLTVSGLSASDRNYDGTPATLLAGTPALLPAQAPGSGTSADGTPYTGDTLTLDGTAAGTFADKHVGNNKPVTVTGITLGGAAAANYSLTQPAGLTAAIAQLPVTVAAVSASKTYDRTTSAAGTPTLTPALAAGDTTRVLEQAFQSAGAGTGNKVIVPSISINDGNGGANYALTLTNFTTGTIDKAPATVTLGDLARNFDGSPKAVTVTTDPVGLAVTLTYNDSSAAPSAVGSYAVVATVSDGNYSGTASATLDIISANPIIAWRAAHFIDSEITAGLAADTADADGDGLSNLVEYTLGTDPRAFSPQPLTVTPVVANQFSLSFLAHSAVGVGYDGLTRKYTVEACVGLADPNTWQPVTGYTTLVGSDQTSDIVGSDQTITITMPATAANMFYRLSVRLE